MSNAYSMEIYSPVCSFISNMKHLQQTLSTGASRGHVSWRLEEIRACFEDVEPKRCPTRSWIHICQQTHHAVISPTPNRVQLSHRPPRRHPRWQCSSHLDKSTARSRPNAPFPSEPVPRDQPGALPEKPPAVPPLSPPPPR